jgi:hypothetical protein
LSVEFSKDENVGAQEVQASIQWPSLCELLFLIHGVVCNLLLIPILHFSPKTLIEMKIASAYLNMA